MTGIPHLENQPPAPVRTLVANGEPLLPEGERLKAEKERVEPVAEPLDRLEQRRQPLHPNEIAAKIENLKRLGVIKQPGRPPHAESRDDLARQALAVVAGGEVVLDIPDGVSLRKFSQRILNGLSKRADTRGYLWSVRDCGHYQVKLTCRGVDSKPAKMTAQIRREKRARKPQDAPPPELAILPVPKPETPTGAESGAALDDVAEEPKDAHAPITDAEREALYNDSPVDAVLLEMPPTFRFEIQPWPAEVQPVAGNVARPVAFLCIADIVPADPPEAAELVDLMLEYHLGKLLDQADGEDAAYERNLERQCELCQAIQRHRRAKQITDALMTAWSADWEFAGTEPPFADLVKRIHSALVDVLAGAEKKE
jgi:hypothetical protein